VHEFSFVTYLMLNPLLDGPIKWLRYGQLKPHMLGHPSAIKFQSTLLLHWKISLETEAKASSLFWTGDILHHPISNPTVVLHPRQVLFSDAMAIRSW
jgi:hypothetical protein